MARGIAGIRTEFSLSAWICQEFFPTMETFPLNHINRSVQHPCLKTNGLSYFVSIFFMYTSKNVKRATDASAGERRLGTGSCFGLATVVTTGCSWLTAIIAFVLILFISAASIAATRQDLINKITNLNAELSVLQTKASALAQDQAKLIARHRLTNAWKSALFVVGTSTSTKGQTLQIPVSFIPSAAPVSSLQQDMVMPSSFTLVSVTAGPAALAAGKSAQVNAVGGVSRLLVFGLNQTPVGEGVLAILTVRSVATAPNGIYAIGAINPVASDGSGIPVPLSVTSGWVKL